MTRQTLEYRNDWLKICLLLLYFQPFPDLDPSYSAPVRAPPTELPLRRDEDYDDEEAEEASGKEGEKDAVRGHEGDPGESLLHA